MRTLGLGKMIFQEEILNEGKCRTARDSFPTGPELDCPRAGVKCIGNHLQAAQSSDQRGPGFGHGNGAAHGSPAHVCHNVNQHRSRVFGNMAAILGDLDPTECHFPCGIQRVKDLPIHSNLVLQGLHGVLHDSKYTNIVRKRKGVF